MKVAGFSFIRNAIKYDYPIIEAITSVLPLVDAFYVAIGNSEDDTIQLIESIRSDKIIIIHSEWDDNLREGGAVLAIETNKAFDAIPNDYQWCIYIQGDEVLHEAGYENIRKGMKTHLKNKNIDGLLLNYRHFYGGYNYLGDSRRWYRREIRVIKNDKSIRSYKDAQGFRKNGEKLKVAHIDAFVHHYGWVKNPLNQMEKAKNFNKYWHDDQWMSEKIPKVELFDYSEIDSLVLFEGTHPHVMKNRIENQDWDFNFDISKKKFTLKVKLLMFIEKITGIRVGEYKNYIISYER